MSAPLRLPTGIQSESVKSGPDKLRGSLVPVLLVGLAAFAVIFILYNLSTRQVADANAKTAYYQGQLDALNAREKVTPPPPTLTPTSCYSYSGEIELIQQLVEQGKFALASELASTDLVNLQTIPCPEARIALAALGYDSALNDIFAAHGLDGRTAYLNWQAAEQKADANNLPSSSASRWPAIKVANYAYNAGLWELARAAFVKGWTEKSIDRQDAVQLDLYYAILRNWGYQLAQNQDPVTKREGLALLRTADEIAKTYALARGEAHQDLSMLLGSDVSAWPLPDYSDVVLATGRQAGSGK